MDFSGLADYSLINGSESKSLRDSLTSEGTFAIDLGGWDFLACSDALMAILLEECS